MAILSFTAWKTLSTPQPPQYAHRRPSSRRRPPRRRTGGAAFRRSEDKQTPAPRAEEATPSAIVRHSKDRGRVPRQGTVEATPPAPPSGASAETTSRRTPRRPGSVGLIKKPEGVVLRFNALSREWERITGATPLREQDRLLNLEPFRTPIELGTAEVDLVSGTEVWARSTPPTMRRGWSWPRPRGAARHGPEPAVRGPVRGQGVKVTPPPGGKVGVERVNRRAPGERRPSRRSSGSTPPTGRSRSTRPRTRRPSTAAVRRRSMPTARSPTSPPEPPHDG